MPWIALLISAALATPDIGPAAFPVFLREGFSSILDFDEPPTQVVLGDQNLFQIEKLNHSILIKPLKPYATTNMFVYFKSLPTKLFILTASEDAEPLYFKRITNVVLKPPENLVRKTPRNFKREVVLKRARFDGKKDYLTVDFSISADSTANIMPNWDLIRLKVKGRVLSPSKLWSERHEVQRDSSVRARLIFTKPSVSSDLSNASIVVPLQNSPNPMTFALRGKDR